MTEPPPTAGPSDTPDYLTAWVVDLAAVLGVSPADVDIPDILNLAKVAAHSVARPAAPLTAFLVGLAAGRSGGSPADIQRAIRSATTLAESAGT